jgi:hypothetical protein
VACPPIGGCVSRRGGLRWCCHPPPIAGSAVDPLLGATHERESESEERDWWALRFHPECRFCSADNNAQPSIVDERLAMIRPKLAHVRK